MANCVLYATDILFELACPLAWHQPDLRLNKPATLFYERVWWRRTAKLSWRCYDSTRTCWPCAVLFYDMFDEESNTNDLWRKSPSVGLIAKNTIHIRYELKPRCIIGFYSINMHNQKCKNIHERGKVMHVCGYNSYVINLNK